MVLAVDAGVDFKRKIMTVKDTKMTFNIWDTAGHQDYRMITANFLKGSSGILLAFDLNRKETYSTLKDWTNIIEEHWDQSKNGKLFLLGNKADLIKADQERPIAPQKLQEFIREGNIDKYFEVRSADSGLCEERDKHERAVPRAGRSDHQKPQPQEAEPSLRHERAVQKVAEEGSQEQERRLLLVLCT